MEKKKYYFNFSIFAYLNYVFLLNINLRQICLEEKLRLIKFGNIYFVFAFFRARETN